MLFLFSFWFYSFSFLLFSLTFLFFTVTFFLLLLFTLTVLFLFFVYTFGCKRLLIRSISLPFSKNLYSHVLFHISQLLNIRRCRTELQGWMAYWGKGKWVSLPEYLSQVPQQRAILHTEAREGSLGVTGWAVRDHSAVSAGSHLGFQASPIRVYADVAMTPTSLSTPDSSVAADKVPIMSSPAQKCSEDRESIWHVYTFDLGTNPGDHLCPCSGGSMSDSMRKMLQDSRFLQGNRAHLDTGRRWKSAADWGLGRNTEMFIVWTSTGSP